MAGDGQRRIVVTMDLVPGKGNVRVAKSLAAQILAVQKNGANGQAKVVAAGLKKQERDAKATARVQTQLAKERSREIEANLRESAKAVAAEKKAVVTAERAKQAAFRATQAAHNKGMAEYKRQTGNVKVAQEQMGERFNTLLGDTLKLSRGFATMGLMGEKDLEKLLRGLVKIQAAFDIIGGAVGVWIRLSRIMRDYAQMTQAAAAAQTALAAAQARSAIAGGVGGVTAAGGRLGDVGSGVTEGVAGGVVASKGGILAGGVGVLIAKFAALAAVVTGAALAIKSLKESAEGRVGEKGTVSGWIGGYFHNRMKQRIKGYTRAERKEYHRGSIGPDRSFIKAVIEEVEGEENATQSKKDYDAKLEREAKQAVLTRQAQAFRDRGMGPRERLGRARQAVERGDEGAEQQKITALQAVLDLRKQEKATVIATNRAAIEGLRQQAKQQIALADQIRQSRLSAEQRFGAADEGTQQALLRLAEKARGGGQLTRAEAAKLLQFAPAGTTPHRAAREAFAGFAQKGKFGQFVGKEQRGQEAGLRSEGFKGLRGVSRAEQELEIAIKDNRNLILRVDRDDEGLIRKLVPEMQRALEDQDAALLEELATAIDKFEGILSEEQANRRGVRVALSSTAGVP